MKTPENSVKCQISEARQSFPITGYSAIFAYVHRLCGHIELSTVEKQQLLPVQPPEFPHYSAQRPQNSQPKGPCTCVKRRIPGNKVLLLHKQGMESKHEKYG